MLKYKQHGNRRLRGYEGRLSVNELKAYDAAFKFITDEVQDMERIHEHLTRLGMMRWEQADFRSTDTVTLAPGSDWNVCAELLKLPKSEVLLCRRENDWKVVQRFIPSSPYARTHGQTEVLASGTNPRQTVSDYLSQAEHTLRLMARNLVAKAQKIVWENFPDDNPGQVVSALVERCDEAVKNSLALKQEQSYSQRQTRGVRV